MKINALNIGGDVVKEDDRYVVKDNKTLNNLVLSRLEFSFCNHHLFCAGNAEPSHSKDGGTDQAPGHRFHPNLTLLEHGFIVIT